MDPWRYVQRASVRPIGSSFIAEARNGPHFAVGEPSSTPTDALESAVVALNKLLAPFIKAQPPSSNDWEDLL